MLAILSSLSGNINIGISYVVSIAKQRAIILYLRGLLMPLSLDRNEFLSIK
jgi:hypothetical protein